MEKEFVNLEEPGIKLLLEKWEFGADDSLFISCNVTEIFASVTHKVGGKTFYGSTRLQPKMHCNILIRKAPPKIAESESDLAIVGEIFRVAAAELDLQCATLLVEARGQVYKESPQIEIKKETF